MKLILQLIFTVVSFFYVLNGVAQDTATMRILMKNGELIISGSDTSKQYNVINFDFDTSLYNTKLKFLDNTKTAPVGFQNGKMLGRGGDIEPDAEGIVQITIFLSNGKYAIEGFPNENNITTSFIINVNKLFIGPFHLKSFQGPNTVPPIVNSNTVVTHINDYQPGYIFYDALYIKKKLEQKDFDTIKMILSYYKITQETISANRYLDNTLKGIYSDNIIEGGEALTSANILSSVGGLDVTAIADGFAKFIVKRTKHELSVEFFNKFKKELDRSTDMQTIFPQTYRALNVIDQEIYNYEAYIQTLRESFEKDLATLPANLPSIIDNHEIFFDKLPEIKAILKSGFYFAQQVQDEQHPGNIIENYPIEYLGDNTNPNIKAAFQTLQLLSTSFKSNAEVGRYWASNVDMQKLFSINDDVLLKIYLGLLEQQANNENITFINADSSSCKLSKIIEAAYTQNVTSLPRYKTYFKNLSFKIQSIEDKLISLKTITNDSLKFESYYTLVSGSIDLMKFLTQVENIPDFPQKLAVQNKINIYFYLAKTLSDIAIDVNRRNYSSAIVNVTQVYDTIFNKKNNDDFIAMPYTPSSENLTDPEKKLEKANLDQSKTKQSEKGEAVKDIFKYGSFMATIVQAQNSDDVESAIESFALPTGSARVKRESLFNVSVNAYCGLFVGSEVIKGVDPNQPFEFNSYGLTAPIGISISLGKQKWRCINPLGSLKKDEGHWSQSIFISLVDLGAIAAYRFTNDSTAQVPTIQLRDIFSPGLFWSIGIPQSPISVNLGAQIGPNLRTVTSNVNGYSNNTYVRYSLSFCVDLPLLNLYTKSD